jgi:hypothetical protein
MGAGELVGCLEGVSTGGVRPTGGICWDKQCDLTDSRDSRAPYIEVAHHVTNNARPSNTSPDGMRKTHRDRRA